MSYVITEYDKLMKQWMQRSGYHYEMMNRVEQDAVNHIENLWYGLTYGGFTPGAKQFGRTTILPPLFDGVLGTVLTIWRQRFTTAGNNTILTGVRTGDITPEDWFIVWVGLAFTSKMNYFTELRWTIGDTTFPRINIEEVDSYNKPAIIFENGYEIPEETYFKLEGYLSSVAPDELGTDERHQRIVPLGFACYRRKDAAIGLPGAAI